MLFVSSKAVQTYMSIWIASVDNDLFVRGATLGIRSKTD
jgi:hypothetical protein